MKKGFTLIEIMIVIAIIGIISGIILVQVRNSQKNTKDAEIMQSSNSILKAAMTDSTSDSSIYARWNAFFGNGSSNTCASSYGSVVPASLRSTVQSACAKILSDIGTPSPATTYYPFIHQYNGSNYFYLMAWLPGKQKFYCVGTNGRSSTTTNYDGSGCGAANSWNCPGCMSDTVR